MAIESFSGGGGEDHSQQTTDKVMLWWFGLLWLWVRWVVSDVKEDVIEELSPSMNDENSVERRYMAKDGSADRIQMKA